MSTDNVIKLLAGAVISALFVWIGVVSGQIETIRQEHITEQKETVKAIWEVSEVLKLANQANKMTLDEIQTDILDMLDDTDDLVRVEASIRKFWKIHRWTLKAINEIRVRANETMIDWPDLE